MNQPQEKLSDAVVEAIKALEAIQVVAGRLDKRAQDAEQARQEAEEQAERDREAKDEAVAKLAGVQQEVIEAKAAKGAQIAALRSSLPHAR